MQTRNMIQQPSPQFKFKRSSNGSYPKGGCKQTHEFPC